MAGDSAWTGPDIGVVVDRGPGQSAGVADNIAIDQVAQASENLSAGSEKRARVEHDQRVEVHTPRAPEKRGNHDKNRAKESHAALPGRQNAPGLEDIVLNQI